MGYEAEMAEDDYWALRAHGLSDAEILAGHPQSMAGLAQSLLGETYQEDKARGFSDAEIRDRAEDERYLRATRTADPTKNPQKGSTMDFDDMGAVEMPMDMASDRGFAPGSMKVVTATENGRSILRAMDTGATREDILSAMTALAGRLADLDRMPDEPDLTDGPCVIMFTREFWDKTYTYSAVRIPATGLWCVTGNKSPQYKNWVDLVTWIRAGKPKGDPLDIRVANGWTAL